MKIKTSELTGAALDWATLKAEGVDFTDFNLDYIDAYQRSTDWTQGGPIIEREGINLCSGYHWEASKDFDPCGYDMDAAVEYGETPLIAAMRCFVASTLGNEVEVPDELC